MDFESWNLLSCSVDSLTSRCVNILFPLSDFRHYMFPRLFQALDKIRFESLTDKSKLDAQPELFIHIIPDKTNNSLSIIDSGIGMTKAGTCCFWLSVSFCVDFVICRLLPNKCLH